MELPVFIINGFLESGKTSFIKDTLASEDFNDGTKTLVIACEDGEEEYDTTEMNNLNTEVVLVEDIAELTKDFYISNCRTCKHTRMSFFCKMRKNKPLPVSA